MKKRWWIIGGIAALFVLALLFGPAALTASGAEPRTCATCHSMEEKYQTHLESKHQEVACSDCHLPHGFPDGLAAKYQKGWVHISKTVSSNVPDEITLKDSDTEILLDNCVACHVNTEHVQASEARSCLNCHRDEPHGSKED